MTAEAFGVAGLAQSACVALYGVGLLYAAWTDFRTLEIPNAVSIAIALAFPPAALAAGLDGQTLLGHAALGAVLLACGALLFAIGACGGGDAKLLAASGLWMDWTTVGPFLFMVAMAGGGLALAVLAATRIASVKRRLTARAIPWAETPPQGRQPVPYGVAIAIAGLIMLPRLSTWPGPALPPVAG